MTQGLETQLANPHLNAGRFHQCKAVIQCPSASVEHFWFGRYVDQLQISEQNMEKQLAAKWRWLQELVVTGEHCIGNLWNNIWW